MKLYIIIIIIIIIRTELYKVQMASYTNQDTSAQLSFPIRLEASKLPKDPLKVVAGSRR